MIVPDEQSAGRSAPRRQFALPEEDVEALDAGGFDWETISEKSGRWLIIRGFILPGIFTTPETSVAISIPSGYPTAALDMAYFNPPIQRVDKKAIPRTEMSLAIDAKAWQRWSRHYTQQNPWRPGEYNVVTHLHLVKHWVGREVGK